MDNKLTTKDHFKYMPDLPIDIVENSDIGVEAKQTLLAAFNHERLRTINVEYTVDGDEIIGSAAFKRMHDIFLQCVWDSGFKMEEEELLLIIPAIIADVKLRFRGLTIEEVEIACKNGVRGEYGDVYGINVRTVNLWLKAYIKSTKKQAISHLKQLQSRHDRGKVASKEEIEAIKTKWMQSVVNCQEELKNTLEYKYYDFGNTLYSFFVRHSLFILDSDEKKGIYEAALDEFKEKRREGAASTKDERKLFVEELEKLARGEHDVRGAIKSRAKHIAVKRMLEKSIAENSDFENVVKEALKKEIANDLKGD